MENGLNRFIEAQVTDYDIALSEIKAGRKRTHWMWYIFPQFRGLGHSQTSKYYEIQSLDEAMQFLNHPELGLRFMQITTELLNLEEKDATKIMGHPDDLKLKSCMTLFLEIDTNKESIFKKVLDKFFEGKRDQKTINLLKNSL